MQPRACREVSRFSLYGEPAGPIEDRFVHVEPLDRRTRPAQGRIQPHAHEALSQLFVLTRGGGLMLADDAQLPFRAPCVLFLPPRTVHGFTFDEAAAGSVLTLSAVLLRDLAARDTEIDRHVDRPHVCSIARRRDGRDLDLLLRRLGAELAWHGPAHETAIETMLGLLLVLVLRIGRDAEQVDDANKRDLLLVARFRQLVEQRFRDRPRIDVFLAALHVTEARLRRGCLRVLHRTPSQVLQERTALEARRLLLHSQATSDEIARRLGFEDAAYFSRFFKRATGQTATEFRRGAAG